MQYPESPWPYEEPEHLADVLREQGATPEEVADLLPTVRRFAEWQAPVPSPTDTQLLLTRLARALPAPSLVRQAIQTNRQRQGSGVRWLLATAQTQVRLFGPAFWLVSALVTIVGAVAVSSMSNQMSTQVVGAPCLWAIPGLPGHQHCVSRDAGAGLRIRAGLSALTATTRHCPAGDCTGL